MVEEDQETEERDGEYTKGVGEGGGYPGEGRNSLTSLVGWKNKSHYDLVRNPID